jgi:hypothetical protein
MANPCWSCKRAPGFCQKHQAPFCAYCDMWLSSSPVQTQDLGNGTTIHISSEQRPRRPSEVT